MGGSGTIQSDDGSIHTDLSFSKWWEEGDEITFLNVDGGDSMLIRTEKDGGIKTVQNSDLLLKEGDIYPLLVGEEGNGNSYIMKNILFKA